MIILTGPSASGKTTIAKELIKNYGFTKFVTSTTREPRVGEIKDVDYHFLSKDEFLNKERNNGFIETVLYNNNYYGTSYDEVTDDKVLIVDINGANKFYEKLGSKAVFFYISCNEEMTKQRMIERGDKLEDIKARISGDKKYFNLNNMKHYDYIIPTDVKSVEEVTKDVYNLYLNKKKIGD